MFAFATVRKIGEGNYLNDDVFILERVRKERALNTVCSKAKSARNRIRTAIKNGKTGSS
ncbi:MAG: hypothetical protein JW994_03930 [Candidatus Omnitrophica bacterium]|nr:hypothetical protein [Candidatus Omnitrophota bacterium]